ncbi:HNH endonuclease signature motif containing protein [Nocardioides cavernaquae]|uniref:HNH endonuclease n=1 Tax=Nocardioides cavernaquae TaxID=2321396 RepID=A0A3A5H4W4_9ACTN|nr:HNH endonuclease signature motif containing protein [Nocardioides cavernaquae]RJS45756.1 HNH endonuclease [Nocardioides cavernaquae]
MDNHFSGSTIVSPLLAMTRSVDEQLKQARGATPAFLPLPEKRELLTTLVSLGNQIDGLLVEALGVCGDVADAEGFKTAGTWLATQTHSERSVLGGLQRLADDVTARYPLVLEGMRTGNVSVRQAEAITRSLDALGTDVSRDIKVEAEARMVAFAAEFDAHELKKLGAAILETIDPDTFEDNERQRLEDELRKAHEATRLTLRQRGDGTTRISGVIPDALAARLRTCLSAFSSPRHDTATANKAANPTGTTDNRDGADSASGDVPDNAGGNGSPAADDSPYLDPVTGKRLPHDRVLGEALCAFIEAADPTRMPIQGGAATTIIVTMDLDKLRAGVGVATAGGERIPAGEVRRLACQAGIVPAVLGGKSEILDLGRTSRLFSPAQRKALRVRYRTCIVEGCDVPGEQCEAHHHRPWSKGGPTNLEDGALACPRHHHLLHDDTYEVTFTPQGEVRLHRRC